MRRIVNLSKNEKLYETILEEDSPFYQNEIELFMSDFAKFKNMDCYRVNSSYCYEYRKQGNLILDYIMFFYD